eukprot:2684580-Lingulodinium_polyedra.AAC.1
MASAPLVQHRPLLNHNGQWGPARHRLRLPSHPRLAVCIQGVLPDLAWARGSCQTSGSGGGGGGRGTHTIKHTRARKQSNTRA